MLIKSVTIDSDKGDVVITRITGGAQVACDGNVLREVREREDRDERYWRAYKVAKIVYGTRRGGEPSATNSMIHDVLLEIERLAGC